MAETHHGPTEATETTDATDTTDTTDALTVRRTADLELGIDELWELISTGDGWSSWLVDAADVDVEPGAEGSASNEGVERVVRFDSVHVGRGVGFSWWDRDDPSSASYVQLDVVELPDGGSRLMITETFLGAAAPSMRCSLAARSLQWDVALVSMWLLARHSLVMA